MKKWSFIKRLTVFLFTVSLYECAGFYWGGFFAGRGTVVRWLVFAGIVFALYFLCIGIYQQYSRRQGALYTQALQKYQSLRRDADGK